jgi:uncharacterized membrane-anchored protein
LPPNCRSVALKHLGRRTDSFPVGLREISDEKEKRMAPATELNTSAPMPTEADFNLKMQGLLSAGIYALSFGVAHSSAALAFFETRSLSIFLAGLILIPLVIGYPLAMLRRIVVQKTTGGSSAGAFVPFAQIALYGLAAILIWVATREAHAMLFG